MEIGNKKYTIDMVDEFIGDSMKTIREYLDEEYPRTEFELDYSWVMYLKLNTLECFEDIIVLGETFQDYRNDDTFLICYLSEGETAFELNQDSPFNNREKVIIQFMDDIYDALSERIEKWFKKQYEV